MTESSHEFGVLGVWQARSGNAFQMGIADDETEPFGFYRLNNEAGTTFKSLKSRYFLESNSLGFLLVTSILHEKEGFHAL